MCVSLLSVRPKLAQPRGIAAGDTCSILMSLIKATEQQQMLLLWPARPWQPDRTTWLQSLSSTPLDKVASQTDRFQTLSSIDSFHNLKTDFSVSE